MGKYDFKTQRLYIETEIITDSNIDLDRSQSNYLLNVLRLKNGANIQVFNGHDGEWLGEIYTSGRKNCAIKILHQTKEQPSPSHLQYCFAPIKQARLDYMVQKATEMGAGIIQPIFTQHTQISRLNSERMKANIIEAAEQCGVLCIPQYREPVKLINFIDQWDNDNIILFGDEVSENENPLKTMQGVTAKNPAVLIGPEGGFSQQERELLLSKNFVIPLSLGPRILRADTAGVAIMTIAQSVLGDW